ncbi:MAG: response regulator [Parcubacteria group bacterium]
MKVLVVEDRKAIREMLAMVFAEAGHTAVLASDGKEAWELLSKDSQFDRIISDNDMPEMGGLELLRRVRADSQTASIPFILMSGVDVVSDKDPTPLEVVCARFGFTSFIVKPFSSDAITTMTRERSAGSN